MVQEMKFNHEVKFDPHRQRGLHKNNGNVLHKYSTNLKYNKLTKDNSEEMVNNLKKSYDLKGCYYCREGLVNKIEVTSDKEISPERLSEISDVITKYLNQHA